MKIEDNHLQSKAKLRRKIIRISPEALISLFRPKAFIECVEGVPEGSEIVGMYYNHQEHFMEIVLQNDEFEFPEPRTTSPFNTPYEELPIHLKSYWGKELQVMRKIIKDVKAANDPLEQLSDHKTDCRSSHCNGCL